MTAQSATAHRRAAALLQRGSGDRRDRRGLPRRAAVAPQIYVYDNNSRDRTREIAAARRARWSGTERQQGKGHVVRRMFADIDADVYVMADGDLTYDPKSAPAMVDLLLAEQLDMVVGTRKHEEKDAYRGGHVLGNKLFTGLLAGLFGRSFSRHLLRLPGVLAALRQKLSGALVGLRDRDRDERPRARAADAGRRGRDRLRRAARGIGFQAFDLSATAGGS